MGLETGNTIASLNAAWPLGSDAKSQGDDHLRLIKTVLKNDVVSKAKDLGNKTIITSVIGSKWQIWGDALIQWGVVEVINTSTTVIFPKAFKGSLPAVTLTPFNSVFAVRSPMLRSLSQTQFGVGMADEAGMSVTGFVYWQAIGEALDAEKMPKSVPIVTP